MDIPKNYSKLIISAFFAALALYFRWIMMNIVTSDMTLYLIPWYDSIKKLGQFNVLASGFTNYTPLYIYLLDIMTFVQWIPTVFAIKLISVIFDFVAALVVYKIVMLKYSNRSMGWVSFFTILSLPTVIVESGLWGQCDVIYSVFLLCSLYFIMKEKNFASILCFSIAFSFKLQAVFFAPIFLILMLRRKFSLYLFFTIPLVYFVSIIPAWLAGRPFFDLLTIYFAQFDKFHDLSMNAPNLYAFISNDQFSTKVLIGTVVAIVLTLTYVVLRWKKWKDLSPTALCFDAVIFTTMIPFLLPKMHERFFFTACLFMIVLAFYDRRMVVPAILIQFSSIFSYIPYLTNGSDIWVRFATILNLAVIFLFFSLYRDFIRSKQNGDVLEIKTEISQEIQS